MNTYKITLTPVSRYFFGGDMTFKVEGQEKYSEQYGSYIIRSNRFPQQTSLLGMLRFLILSHDTTAFSRTKNKITDPQRAQELIGASSFTVNDDYQENDFRCIRQLYPCFLELKDDSGAHPLLVSPCDYGHKVEFNSGYSVSVNGQYSPLPHIPGYNPKEPPKSCYLYADKRIPESELFIEDPRIGIEKDYQGIKQADNSALYKQIFYRLGNEKYEGKVRFAFYADTENVDLTQFNGSLVNVGGDDSKFLFEATLSEGDEKAATYASDYNHSFEEKEAVRQNIPYKVVLLSDAYLPPVFSGIRLWSYAVSSIIPFRFLCTNINTDNYTFRSPVILRSKKKYYLYTKGSVFFCKDEAEKEKLTTALASVPCFRQIGYNYFQLFQLNTITNIYE